MNELRPGLWTWSAPHPSWTPEEGGPDGWGPDVRSYALDAGDSLVLFDPLVEASDVDTLANGRPVVVVLTCYWHRRSTPALVDALGAIVHAPATEIGELGVPAEPYEVGDDLPGDIEPQVGAYASERTLWIRGHAALVSGDALVERPQGLGLQPESWLEEGMTPASLRGRLQPLLELPVQLLLPTHGDPVEADAEETLRRALAT